MRAVRTAFANLKPPPNHEMGSAGHGVPSELSPISAATFALDHEVSSKSLAVHFESLWPSIVFQFALETIRCTVPSGISIRSIAMKPAATGALAHSGLSTVTSAAIVFFPDSKSFAATWWNVPQGSRGRPNLLIGDAANTAFPLIHTAILSFPVISNTAALGFCARLKLRRKSRFPTVAFDSASSLAVQIHLGRDP